MTEQLIYNQDPKTIRETMLKCVEAATHKNRSMSPTKVGLNNPPK